MGHWCELRQSHAQALKVYDTLKNDLAFLYLLKSLIVEENAFKLASFGIGDIALYNLSTACLQL
jgi:hypothetical protein